MQIKITTDYAIRIVLYATLNMHRKDRVPSAEFSEKLCIPQSVVLKTCAKLKDHGLLDVSAGAVGGCKMIKDPAEVSLFDIIDIFEPTTRINRCLEDDRYCSRFATSDCPVRKGYARLQIFLENQLKSMTIQRLIDGDLD